MRNKKGKNLNEMILACYGLKFDDRNFFFIFIYLYICFSAHSAYFPHSNILPSFGFQLVNGPIIPLDEFGVLLFQPNLRTFD